MLGLMLNHVSKRGHSSHCSTIQVVKVQKAHKLLLQTTNIVMIRYDKNNSTTIKHVWKKTMPVIDMGDILTCSCNRYIRNYLTTGIGCLIKPTAMENGCYLSQNSTESNFDYVLTVGNRVNFFNTLIFMDRPWGYILMYILIWFLDGFVTLLRCPLAILSSTFERNW